MNTPKYLIYGLRDAHTKEVRYVGKSTSGLSRPRSHYYPSSLKKRTKLSNWIRKQKRNELASDIVILHNWLDYIPSGEEIDNAETEFIAFFRKTWNRLTNETDGGAGRYGYVMSAESKTKSRESFMKSDWCIIGLKETPPMLGRHHSEESKTKMSLAQSYPIIRSDDKYYESVPLAAEDTNCTIMGIHHVLKGRCRSVNGYSFVIAGDPRKDEIFDDFEQFQTAQSIKHQNNLTRLAKKKLKKRSKSFSEARSEKVTERNKKQIVRSDGLIFNSITEAAESIGRAISSVSQNLSGKTKSCGNYSFLYYKKESR